MDYTSTLETLEGFWMTLSRCSEHRVRVWAILYSLVLVRNPGNCSLYSTRCLVCSQSINKHAIKMDYTNPLSMSSAHWVGGLAILYPLVKVSSVGIAHGSQQCALFNLSQLFSMPYRLITLSRCSVHRVRAWMILHPLVKVSNPGNCSL